ALLRDEILAAATELLDAAGSESDLSLRGIATAAGISAPAIYPHFPHRDAILASRSEQSCTRGAAETAAATAPQTTPLRPLPRGHAVSGRTGGAGGADPGVGELPGTRRPAAACRPHRRRPVHRPARRRHAQPHRRTVHVAQRYQPR